MQVVRFATDALEVEILPEVGARVHRLRAFGADLLRTPDDPATHRADPFFWGAYVMAPWANRLTAGGSIALGQQLDLPPNFPDGSAIHGQVYDRPWRHDGGGFFTVGGGGGWPWPYEVTQRIALDASRLRLEYGLTNLSDEPMPAGLGIHPWWRRPLEVAIPASSVFPATTDSPPRPAPVADALDRRELDVMPDGIDAAWTDLEPPGVLLRWPQLGIRLAMRAEAPTSYVVAASPADLDAVAVELQTHAPQGLRRLERGEPGAMAVIGPQETLGMNVEISVERDAGG